MKFLCVDCDEAMHLKETRGPDRGSLAVIFSCPRCDREIAMLTNAMETQMVRTLGVQIGGRTVPPEPMEMVRGSLADPPTAAEEDPANKPETEAQAAPPAASKCPFTGMANDAFEAAAGGPVWTPEAEARLARIPSFVRPMVRKSIEQHARERGHTRIDVAVMEAVRGDMGM